MSDRTLFERLKERKVVQWALAYLAGAFVVFQLLDALSDPLGLSTHVQQAILAVVGIGFVVTLVLAWYHGEKGRQKASGAELLIIALLLLISGVLLYTFTGDGDPSASAAPGRVSGNDKPSIAVLPLDNFSPDAADAFFADGVHEEITSRLSQISALTVIARSSVESYRINRPAAQTIAAELGVDYLLEGSARIAGDLVRLTVQLIDGTTAEHVWAESFNRDYTVEDVIAVQVEIAEEVTALLRAAITPEESERIGQLPTSNPEAYEAYLRPIGDLFRGYGESDLRYAARMYQRAVELDPNFALAWAQLAVAHSQIWWFAYDRTETRVNNAFAALDRALALAPEHPMVRRAAGYLAYNLTGDYEKALAELQAALDLQPSLAEGHASVGYVLRRMGQFELAAENILKGHELDPLAPRLAVNLGETYMLMRAYSKAEEYLNRAAELLPGFARAYALQAQVQIARNGDLRRAAQILEDGISEGAEPGEDTYLANVWLIADILDGRYADALAKIDNEGLDAINTQFAYVPVSLFRAEIHSLQGQRARAREHFESARAALEVLLARSPDDERLHGAMGLALAGLGRNAEAIAAAERGVELMPRSRDAYKALYRLEELARVLTRTGEHDRAVELLTDLVESPGIISASWLRVDPRYDALRNHPGFQSLVATAGTTVG